MQIERDETTGGTSPLLNSISQAVSGVGSQNRRNFAGAPQAHIVKREKTATSGPIPGRIDIVVSNPSFHFCCMILKSLFQSPSADSKDATIASLSVASQNASAGDPMVLNASGTNSTQVYLVPNPTGVNGTQSSGSNSTSVSRFQTVNIQVPVNGTTPHCATFDPQPPKPEPLTVEECNNGTETTHKSQVFAYYADSGVIRPMWYEGEEDNTDPEDEDDNSDTGDSGSGDGRNSTSSIQDPGTPSSNKIVGVTKVSDGKFGNSTRPPSLIKSFLAESPKNVTLVFTPLAPSSGSNSTSAVPSSSTSASSAPSASSSTTTAVATAAAVPNLPLPGLPIPGLPLPNLPLPNLPLPNLPLSGLPLSGLPVAVPNLPVAIPATPGDSSSVSVSPSSTASGTTSVPSTATTLAALAVEVFNPYISSGSGTPSGSSAILTSSTATPTASASSSVSASANVADFLPSSVPSAGAASTSVSSSTVPTSSIVAPTASPSANVADVSSSSVPSTGSATSASSSMTPVSTAPYEWMFTEGNDNDEAQSGMAKGEYGV